MLSQEGEHLPATLHALAQRAKKPGMEAKEAKAAETRVYATISNRLSMLIDNLRSLKVDHDEKRDTLTVCAGDNQGVWYPAKALSDGTLRFLALAVLEHDSSGRNVICLEEPENGIHPQRIPAIINLLQDIATDIHMEVDETNPPRQVIINTHSPQVVRQIPDDSLVLARRAQLLVGSGLRNGLEFRYLDHTWRSECDDDTSRHIHKGELLDYLSNANGMNDASAELATRPRRKLVGQREDLQQLKLNL
jgi:predicted ATPase